MEKINNFDEWLVNQNFWNADTELRKIVTFLDPASDVLGLLIRGSLIIEGMIDRLMVGKFSVVPKSIKRMPLSNKITIYEAFGGSESCIVWLKKFVGYRNEFAHRLVGLPERDLFAFLKQDLDSLGMDYGDLGDFDILYAVIINRCGEIISDIASILEIEISGAELMIDGV
ncbi:hypothetical protein [Deinococcus depolymerans]|uniref:DUF86 domain-containing protein n=1 Tax=Deinococcus depolymerans TaxID=392408 RepID=A0ABP3M3V5_9DEIO